MCGQVPARLRWLYPEARSERRARQSRSGRRQGEQRSSSTERTTSRGTRAAAYLRNRRPQR